MSGARWWWFGLMALAAACSQARTVVLKTPESVLYDPLADVWLVSNIAGEPLAKDGNGFIARVSPDDGKVVAWIEGGHNGAVLNAPKGMALSGDELWVADIDVLRRFDRHSGAPRGEVEIPGASFLNDVAAGPDGSVYVSDTGLDASFAPTGSDAIWQVTRTGEVTALIRGEELGQPNGIYATPTGLYVVNWRDGAFFQVDYRGSRSDLGRAPQAQLDGLVRVVEPVPAERGGGERPVWYATSWQGRCIYRFDLGGGMTPLPSRLEQPADLGYDSKRRQLLVPLFGQDRLEIVPLGPGPAPR